MWCESTSDELRYQPDRGRALFSSASRSTLVSTLTCGSSSCTIADMACMTHSRNQDVVWHGIVISSTIIFTV